MYSTELERVRRNTTVAVNEWIDAKIAATVEEYATADDEELSARIAALEREWDIERVLETAAPIVALAGITLSVARDRRWLILSSGVLGFLLLHGTQGWAPPIPVLRRLGVRTRNEIDRERFALKFLRGDFDHIRNSSGKIVVSKLLAASAL